jgi:hypothetical protein
MRFLPGRIRSAVLGIMLVLLSAVAAAAAHPHLGIVPLVLAATDDSSMPSSAPVPLSGSLTSSQLDDQPATQRIQRLDQLDRAQYASASEYQQWSASACSAAAMAEVFNAYGRHYRVADVLHVEQSLHVITPDQGLLDARGVAWTANVLGFVASWGDRWDLARVLSAARQGHPVIVSFPPDRFPGGHLLVVKGGDGTTIELIDSSRLNMTSMSRTRFLQLWGGFAAVLTPAADTLFRAPTVSAGFVEQVLSAYHSPAAGTGQVLWSISTRYGIDPAFALGFFAEESRFGTQGMARVTKSLGNLRCIAGVPCLHGYAAFPTWTSGYEAWAKLLAGSLYEGAGLYRLPAIVHRYAPAADHNDEQAYVTAVMHVVQQVRAAQIAVLS